jgi:hypothetical protein
VSHEPNSTHAAADVGVFDGDRQELLSEMACRGNRVLEGIIHHSWLQFDGDVHHIVLDAEAAIVHVLDLFIPNLFHETSCVPSIEQVRWHLRVTTAFTILFVGNPGVGCICFGDKHPNSLPHAQLERREISPRNELVKGAVEVVHPDHVGSIQSTAAGLACRVCVFFI